jgi:sigma-B regulation protein RsbU (phosphoserine phosphatase)
MNLNAVELGVLDFQKMGEAVPYFWRQVQTYKSISYVGFANEQGQWVRAGWFNRFSGTEPLLLGEQLTVGGGDYLLYNVDEKGNRTQLARKVPNYDVRTRPFYKVAFETGKPTWTKIFTSASSLSLTINASTPYYDRNGKPVGILTSSIGLEQISAFLQSLKISRTGQVFIIEPSGDLVATSLKNQPLWVEDPGKELKRFRVLNSKDPLIRSSSAFLYDHFGKLENIRQSYQLEFILDGKRQFLQVSPFSDEYGLNWLIVVGVPEADFMEQINANTGNTIMLCLLTLGAAILIGILTARLIARPILRLIDASKGLIHASKELASGNLSQRVDDTTELIEVEEIETLENSFNNMADQLQESFATLEDKVQERTADLAKANEQISTLNEKLKEENLRMGAELDVARQIQQMILPKPEELADIEGLDIAGYMEPAHEVGGDYYDVLHTDGVVTLAIGDVTGHGLESGLLMLMTQTAVRILQEIRESDSVRFLDTLNRTIYKNVKRMNSDKSLTLAILNYAQGQISISGQHEETIIVRNGGHVERIDTMDLGFPIGLDDEIADFISHTTLELQPGDGVVLYTDGIPEAEDINKMQYGVEQLCEVISQNWHKFAQEIKDAVIADVRRHIGKQKVYDDITLLVLKRQGAIPENGHQQIKTMLEV